VNKNSANFHRTLAILFKAKASNGKQQKRIRRANMVAIAQELELTQGISLAGTLRDAGYDLPLDPTDFSSDEELSAAKTPLDDDEDEDEDEKDETPEDDDLEDDDDDLEDDDEDDDLEDDELDDDDEDDEDDDEDEEEDETEDDPKPLRVKTRL
jgi:hypothetical protein